jgi:N-acetylglucosamine-6-phosphate deacetylase
LSPGPLVLRAGTLVPGGVDDEELTPGWIVLDGERIGDVGAGAPPDGLPVVELHDRILAPGFLDLHVHGGGGAQVNGASPEAVAQTVLDVATFHVRHGTTGLLATTVSDSPGRLVAAVQGVAQAAALRRSGSARILGAHLEGPWIAVGKAGAQNPAVLRPPNTLELHGLLDSAPGVLRLVTIAPELPGAIDVIRAGADAGVVMSVGHTEADVDTVQTAFDAGARHVTHLFNAMPGLHHRAPGPVGAALADPRVTVEVIADGIHLHPGVLEVVASAARGRMVAVTDAISAAGLMPGRYSLGELDVVVRDGRAVLADHPATLAGSVLTMDRAVTTLVAAGVPLAQAIAAATSTPARTLGESRKGRIAPGADADLVVLEPDLSAAATVVGGRVAHDAVGVLGRLAEASAQ